MMKNCTALLIIDVQVGSFEENKVLYKETELLKTIQQLVSKARSVTAPIFYMKFNGKQGSLLRRGTPGWKIHEAIAPTKHDSVLEKNHPDSFHKTNLQQELEIRNIKQIVIAGIQSEICIDATCRRAFSLGYDVTLAEDGHSTYDSIVLSAPRIIKHHNDILAQWFADVKKARDIEF
ncbi:cysteine hydrolase [Bacillus clarus]|uniref:Cysteine hydrolase n=1 Tax=Bacillus clarus TaxID=2338372 RepID=A0A090Z0Q1_9BACI|nr:cysteine hydrolase family protein [Bacillus clarus]KFN04202.1 isochorismatase family protein [Bacillus clarus]RFT62117.1 cysteine hydrolase [Bacillus clarus]